jgi:hypothetical protein
MNIHALYKAYIKSQDIFMVINDYIYWRNAAKIFNACTLGMKRAVVKPVQWLATRVRSEKDVRCLPPRDVQTASGPHTVSCLTGSGRISPGIKRQECEVDHLPLSRTEISNARGVTFTRIVRPVERCLGTDGFTIRQYLYTFVSPQTESDSGRRNLRPQMFFTQCSSCPLIITGIFIFHRRRLS